MIVQGLIKSFGEDQQFRAEQGLQGVPTIVFDRQHLVTGAQGVDSYVSILDPLAKLRANPYPLRGHAMARAAPYDRDAALDAAMALFWDKGYHATSLKDLEATLAMKPGSIYAAFTSKENLYLLALERYFEASRLGVRTAMARASSPLKGLADHFRGFAKLAPHDKARQACMMTKTLIDTRTTDPAIVEQARAYLSTMQHEFSACFARAIAQGELPDTVDPDRLARRYLANISALRIELARGAPPEDVQTLAEDMALEIEGMCIAAPVR